MADGVRLSRRARQAPGRRRPRPTGLMLALWLVSLGGLVRVYAMPAEATTRESWYSYRQDLAWDFTAWVRPGVIYPEASQPPEQLVRIRLPVDPPAYRRVVVARLTDGVRLRLPYRFAADRPGEITARFWVDGQLVAPNLWRRPYPLSPPREHKVSGGELVLDESIYLSVTDLLAELQRVQEETGLGHDVVELRVQPVVEVEVAGQRRPVQARLAPEFVLVFRGGGIALEIDEPRVVSDAQSFTETRVVPLTVRVFGRDVPVALVRTAVLGLLAALTGTLLGVAALRWLRRRPEESSDLRRLGAVAIRAHSFEVPSGAALVEVTGVRQLLDLHVQSERPVVRVGQTCYLLDGAACYRLELEPAADGGTREAP